MNYRYIIDSYTWIEYFMGTSRGKAAKKFIESGFALTPTVVLAELSYKYLKAGWNFFEKHLNYICEVGEIANLDMGIAVTAGQIKQKMRISAKNFSMSDAVILATANSVGGKVVTGDKDFSGIKEAIMI